jgi:hypothetical protein
MIPSAGSLTTVTKSRSCPCTAHLIGNYWQIKIDGVIRGNFPFSSARMAAEEAKKLIDTNSLGS